MNDFQMDETGTYQYRGIMYRYDEDRYPWKKTVLFLWLGTAITAGCVLGLGFLPLAGLMNCLYVAIPYLASIFCTGRWFIGMVRIAGGGKLLREYVYEAEAEKISLRALWIIGANAVMCVGEIVYLFLHPSCAPVKYIILFFVLCTFLSAGAYLLWRVGRNADWKYVKNE